MWELSKIYEIWFHEGVASYQMGRKRDATCHPGFVVFNATEQDVKDAKEGYEHGWDFAAQLDKVESMRQFDPEYFRDNAVAMRFY